LNQLSINYVISQKEYYLSQITVILVGSAIF